MPVTGFSHFNLRASRPVLEALREFYVDLIGLEIGQRPASRRFGYWLYAGPRDLLHLTEADADEHRAMNVVGTLDHIAFACSGRAAFEARLRERGVSYRVADNTQGGPRQLFLSDPAGNGIELNFADDDA